MKQKTLGALLLLLVLTACAASRRSAEPTDNLQGEWRLAAFMPSQKKTLAEVFGERVVEMQFNAATKGVAGTTGCNRFAGTYTADTANQGRKTRSSMPGAMVSIAAQRRNLARSLLE